MEEGQIGLIRLPSQLADNQLQTINELYTGGEKHQVSYGIFFTSSCGEISILQNFEILISDLIFENFSKIA